MTISDDPKKDATDLDDDALFEAYLDGDTAGAKSGAPETDSTEEMPDWPPAETRNTTFVFDAETLAWFRANHADWQREVGFVLRAWVAVHADGATTRRPRTGS